MHSSCRITILEGGFPQHISEYCFTAKEMFLKHERHIVEGCSVFQQSYTKWARIFATPSQKAIETLLDGGPLSGGRAGWDTRLQCPPNPRKRPPIPRLRLRGRPFRGLWPPRRAAQNFLS